MFVRLAVPADEPALQALCAVQPEGGAAVYAPHSLLARGKLYERFECWVAESEGRVVGATLCALKEVELHGRRCRVGHIFNLRVAAGERGRGVGAQLCRQGEGWAMESGAAGTYALVSSSNPAALRLFSNGGYRPLGRVAYRMCEALRDAPAVAADWTITAPDLPDMSACALRPADLRAAIYTAAGPGGFLGQVKLRESGAHLSVWDKDRRIDRRALKAGDQRLFLFDLQAPDRAGVRELIKAVSARYPWAGKLVLFLDAEQREGAMMEGIAPLDREELVAIRTTETIDAPSIVYPDIRD